MPTSRNHGILEAIYAYNLIHTYLSRARNIEAASDEVCRSLKISAIFLYHGQKRANVDIFSSLSLRYDLPPSLTFVHQKKINFAGHYVGNHATFVLPGDA